MNKGILIITDADAIIALVNSSDANHIKAKNFSIKLAMLNASVVIPMTGITEAITTLQRKIKRPDLAKLITQKVYEKTIPLIDSQIEDFDTALKFYNSSGSKNNTFFDAVIAGTATRYEADAIFSFDEWYRKLGFILVEDFISNDNR
ncbi:MAG: type II toxin-antitoxin system VapC family toxin [Patescibacteria group bacterium]